MDFKFSPKYRLEEINKDNVLDAFRNRIEKCYFKPIKMLNDKRFLIGLSLIGSII